MHNTVVLSLAVYCVLISDGIAVHYGEEWQ